jgi:hypothetical protein
VERRAEHLEPRAGQVQGSLPAHFCAWVDSEEVMPIAKRSEMRLFQRDAYLEYAYLGLTEEDREKARDHVAEVQRFARATSNRRRKPDVKELEARVD